MQDRRNNNGPWWTRWRRCTGDVTRCGWWRSLDQFIVQVTKFVGPLSAVHLGACSCSYIFSGSKWIHPPGHGVPGSIIHDNWENISRLTFSRLVFHYHMILYSVSPSFGSDVALLFLQKAVLNRARQVKSRITAHASHTKTKNVCTRLQLQAAPVCLSHCQEMARWTE